MRQKAFIFVLTVLIYIFAVLYFIPYIVLICLRKIIDVLLYPGQRINLYPFIKLRR